VFAYAAAQVKKCLDISKELGAENYVFWGGREGYQVSDERVGLCVLFGRTRRRRLTFCIIFFRPCSTLT